MGLFSDSAEIDELQNQPTTQDAPETAPPEAALPDLFPSGNLSFRLSDSSLELLLCWYLSPWVIPSARAQQDT
jgi:hypothetical protein